jgi:hypothetical protein
LPDELDGPVSAAVALSGGAIAVVGTIFTWTNNRRAKYERVLSETSSLTTGAVAEARHILGTVFEQDPKARLSTDQIKHLFTVLWAFERLYALYESLGSTVRPGKVSRPDDCCSRLSEGQSLHGAGT